MSSQGVCAACNRTIDAAAKLCPYCGANPQTGERLDTQALLQEVFRPREMTTSDTVMEYARQRQGVVIAISVFVGFLIIAALHQFVTRRNANVTSDLPAVPLTEITDITKRDDLAPVKMPELDFQYDGVPRRMRTYVVERGATTPPEVLAAQQAAAAARAAQQQPPAAPAPAPQTPQPQPVRQPTR
jgi:hypothetical protein